MKLLTRQPKRIKYDLPARARPLLCEASEKLRGFGPANLRNACTCLRHAARDDARLADLVKLADRLTKTYQSGRTGELDALISDCIRQCRGD